MRQNRKGSFPYARDESGLACIVGAADYHLDRLWMRMYAQGARFREALKWTLVVASFCHWV